MSIKKETHRREFLKALVGSSVYFSGLSSLFPEANAQDIVEDLCVKDWTNHHSYLCGAFKPVVGDMAVSEPLKVIEGRVPPEINGYFFRNGPNPLFDPPGLYHWFDGDGMVHCAEFRNGQVWYRRALVKTERLAAEQRRQRSIRKGASESFGWKGGVWDIGFGGNNNGMADNLWALNSSNTGLIWHHGKLLSGWYIGGKPYELELTSLDTVGKYDFNGQLEPKRGVYAHSKVDPVTGELFFIDTTFNVLPGWPDFLFICRVEKDGQKIHTAKIPMPGARVLHDLAITENYVICVIPATPQLEPGLLGYSKKARTQVIIIPKSEINLKNTKPIYARVELDFAYVLHTVNAFETVMADGKVKLTFEATRIPDPADPELENSLSVPRINYSNFCSHACQWNFELAPKVGSLQAKVDYIEGRQLIEHMTEFPTINMAHNGQYSRYAYFPKFAAKNIAVFDGLMKYDRDRDSVEIFNYPAGEYGSEAQFIPRSGSLDHRFNIENKFIEDDGWVVAFVAKENGRNAELYIWEAPSFKYGPVARLEIPAHIPLGFHGLWVPQDS